MFEVEDYAREIYVREGVVDKKMRWVLYIMRSGRAKLFLYSNVSGNCNEMHEPIIVKKGKSITIFYGHENDSGNRPSFQIVDEDGVYNKKWIRF